MSKRKITFIVLAVTVVALIGYDVWAALQGNEVTISECVWRWSKNYPLLPFSFGVLSGHLFWPSTGGGE